MSLIFLTPLPPPPHPSPPPRLWKFQLGLRPPPSLPPGNSNFFLWMSVDVLLVATGGRMVPDILTKVHCVLSNNLGCLISNKVTQKRPDKFVVMQTVFIPLLLGCPPIWTCTGNHLWQSMYHVLGTVKDSEKGSFQ